MFAQLLSFMLSVRGRAAEVVVQKRSTMLQPWIKKVDVDAHHGSNRVVKSPSGFPRISTTVQRARTGRAMTEL
jgi:hypothetical protein